MSHDTSNYQRVAERFGHVLAQVRDDQWSNPTPCTEWNARELAVHVIETHRRIYRNLDDTIVVEVGDDDVKSSWLQAFGAVRDALADPVRSDTMVSAFGGEMTFATLVANLLTTDTLCHTWDLARATGQDETLDEAAVAAAHEMLVSIDGAIRRPGGFAPALEADEEASAQHRFLRFAGRSA